MYSALSTFNTTTEVPLARHRAPNCSPGSVCVFTAVCLCVHGVCVCVCSLLCVCTAPGVFTVCVCSLLCVCTLDGLNAEHEFRVWVTILGHMSRHFTTCLIVRVRLRVPMWIIV